MFGTSGQKNPPEPSERKLGRGPRGVMMNRHVDLVLRDIARTPRVKVVAGWRVRRGSRERWRIVDGQRIHQYR